MYETYTKVSSIEVLVLYSESHINAASDQRLFIRQNHSNQLSKNYNHKILKYSGATKGYTLHSIATFVLLKKSTSDCPGKEAVCKYCGETGLYPMSKSVSHLK